MDGVWYALTLEKRPEPEEVGFPNGQSEWKITKVWDVLEWKSVAYEFERWHAPEGNGSKPNANASFPVQSSSSTRKMTTPGKPGVFFGLANIVLCPPQAGREQYSQAWPYAKSGIVLSLYLPNLN